MLNIDSIKWRTNEGYTTDTNESYAQLTTNRIRYFIFEIRFLIVDEVYWTSIFWVSSPWVVFIYTFFIFIFQSEEEGRTFVCWRLWVSVVVLIVSLSRTWLFWVFCVVYFSILHQILLINDDDNMQPNHLVRRWFFQLNN